MPLNRYYLTRWVSFLAVSLLSLEVRRMSSISVVILSSIPTLSVAAFNSSSSFPTVTALISDVLPEALHFVQQGVNRLSLVDGIECIAKVFLNAAIFITFSNNAASRSI
jgi:hypothetical protein